MKVLVEGSSETLASEDIFSYTKLKAMKDQHDFLRDEITKVSLVFNHSLTLFLVSKTVPHSYFLFIEVMLFIFC